ncbi:hypothetical protein LCGC14_0818540 [marine sediment metagenome]|uniref:Uncharacterized protein n=1 Tax=marine sediment metagenome TaxID=412755 RepID=A0A0F9PP63_9ZZZZ
MKDKNVKRKIVVTSPNLIKDKYHSPKCKKTEFIDYGETVECTTCLIEFDKKLLGKIPDDEILSRMEIGGVLDEFEELKDPKKAKKFLDSITDDLDEK